MRTRSVMRARAFCVLYLMLVVCIASSEARQPPATITDGLIFEKGLPQVAKDLGAATQIQLNGLVDTTKYKDGLILDKEQKIKYEVYEWDPVKMDVKGKVLESKVDLGVKGFKKWSGFTQRSGGYPPGLYSIRISVEKFRYEIGKDPIPATLVKEPFEIK